ncbi:MAG: carbohydrate kinase family protein [Rhodococcus sp. (in: high G+C Gram-positive bacteria)]|uniref:carbohydrate kinase family protein n=1 Tax=Rhodococcus sp. TaxID=1831 RepID=UPI002AD68BFE|nr:carbohydrate kinase family protein [Rhodococcus sp. (in: high G+C Gram-positive bacteria)]MDZ7910674.1 carbohydrate kinase family protein [Rhodococcus sp. (in: high G+C Gram-positive bacteria)]
MIVFFGYANNDVTVHVPHVPVLGERVQATAVDSIDGGMNANAAVSAARMGAHVAFAGAVGSDARSAEFLAGLERDGVDTSWAPRDAFLSTAVVLIADGGDRSIISQDDANDADRLASVLSKLSVEGGRLFVDGYRASMLPPELPAGVSLAIDLDGCTDIDAALHAFALADHVIVGRSLWQNNFGIETERWSTLAAEHGTHLVVTDGEHGWTLVTPSGETITEPAVPVDVVDAVGAGDCFCGTYIAFVDAGELPAHAARLAGASAALACATAGPRGCPSITDLNDFTATLATVDLQEIR